jgi:hypothetical protein
VLPSGTPASPKAGPLSDVAPVPDGGALPAGGNPPSLAPESDDVPVSFGDGVPAAPGFGPVRVLAPPEADTSLDGFVSRAEPDPPAEEPPGVDEAVFDPGDEAPPDEVPPDELPDDEPPDDTEPDAPDDPVGSAKATAGRETMAALAPSATASAPTRPTKRA